MSADLRRALLFALIMVGASLLAWWMTPRVYLADVEPRQHLAELLPRSFGDWSVDPDIVPVAPSPDLQKVIAETYDETEALTYRDGHGHRVMLSVAYGRNQHKGMITHRPDVCYPAQGFQLVSPVLDAQLSLPAGSMPVKRLVAQRQERREPVTYWVVVGDQRTEFGYAFRAVAIRYGLRGLIPDGVLMRVSTLGDDDAAGFALQQAFVRDLHAALTPAQRLRLYGRGQE